ncbi:MAG: 2-C-methyl-D-erythritol 4-phosphate cytidylyltransferase [Clostridiales bacterium]|nr:2-C-methyl-D-erythritol 4-phosphate cytidylyltransferase [Clostridiales bacterium]
MSQTKIHVIIPAAGKGERMGGDIPKVLLKIDGIPVVIRTLQAFDRMAMETGVSVSSVVVASPGLIPVISSLAEEYGITTLSGVIEGGATRTGSVYNGVRYLELSGIEPDSYVFVHDGARCLVDMDTLTCCLEGVRSHEVCVASVPVKNTLKICQKDADGSMKVVSTPDRDNIREVQTPQCFRADVIIKSYENAIKNGITATDDTALAEILGYEVFLTEGSYSNIKITTQEDIPLAEEIIRRRAY